MSARESQTLNKIMLTNSQTKQASMLTIEHQEDKNTKYKAETAKHVSPSPDIISTIELHKVKYHVC